MADKKVSNNFVAKFARKFNKSKVFTDKKKESKLKPKKFNKSDNFYRDGDNT